MSQCTLNGDSQDAALRPCRPSNLLPLRQDRDAFSGSLRFIPVGCKPGVYVGLTLTPCEALPVDLPDTQFNSRFGHCALLLIVEACA